MQTQLDQFSDPEKLSRALDASRRQLEAATLENDELLRLHTLLANKLASLELELAKAHRHANYDELTGLPNRRLLLDRFNQAAALANRHRQELMRPRRQPVELAMLFFDLNDFKGVNDQLGHDAGDKLLQQVATRLLASVRQSDTACRYGGDEFVILLTDIDSRDHAVTLLQRIRARLAPPYLVDRQSIRLTVSNGMAIYPTDAKSFAALLRLSDRLMFGNKSVGRGRARLATAATTLQHDARKASPLDR